jgi:hypothetical protein
MVLVTVAPQSQSSVIFSRSRSSPLIGVSGRHGVDDVELGPVIYAMPRLATGLALIPDLFADRHADASLFPATAPSDPRLRMDAGDLVPLKG